MIIYKDRERLMRTLRASAEERLQQLEIEEAARACTDALLAADLPLAQFYAQQYSLLKRSSWGSDDF